MSEPTFAGYTDTERLAVVAALRTNCVCEYTDNTLVKRCPLCCLLEDAQPADESLLKHLLFMRRERRSLLVGEGLPV